MIDSRKPTPLERRRRAIDTFMVRVGQVGRTARRLRCEHTLPLIPLVLILDADRTLRSDACELVGMVHA